jgi:hypothetical protein
MLQSVENFNVQANILGNYVGYVDICTQVYYFFIDTIWTFEDVTYQKIGVQNLQKFKTFWLNWVLSNFKTNLLALP